VTPFIAFQYPVRRVCSDRRHHIVVVATQAGAIMAYKNEDTKLVWDPRAFRTVATYLERSQYEPQTKKAFEVCTGGHDS